MANIKYYPEDELVQESTEWRIRLARLHQSPLTGMAGRIHRIL